MKSGSRIKLFAGTASKKLGQKIVEHLKTELEKVDTNNCFEDYRLSEMTVKKFSNDNIFVRLEETVREADTYIIQSSGSPVNDRFMELLITIDAMRRSSAGRITAIIPYLPYSRSDKVDQPRVPLTARLVADLIEAAGADRVVTMDLHADQIQGFFNIAIDHLKATGILASYVEEHFLDAEAYDERDKWVVISPDAGSAKRAQRFARKLGLPMAVILKERQANDDQSEVMQVIGQVEGKSAIIFDDEIDTAGSMTNAITVLCEEFGVREVIAVATHGIFSGPALCRIEENPHLKAVVVTDTLDVPARGEHCLKEYERNGIWHKDEVVVTKIHTCTVSELLAATIRSIHFGESVTHLYERWQIGSGKKDRGRK
ncbi:MAG: ribose-phosphate diphosphokinase [Firmicutes bacterium]|nr:ribose-phosphate diphosphokinase [Bacillota bacterium]